MGCWQSSAIERRDRAQHKGERAMRLWKSPVVLNQLCLTAALALLAGAMPPSPARAAGTDCPPMGTLPNYLAIGPAEHHEFQGYDFEHETDDGGNERVTVAGKYCHQEYHLKEGPEEMSAVEILHN
jgi:hypothetical protein